jgi:hypothetical protein
MITRQESILNINIKSKIKIMHSAEEAVLQNTAKPNKQKYYRHQTTVGTIEKEHQWTGSIALHSTFTNYQQTI